MTAPCVRCGHDAVPLTPRLRQIADRLAAEFLCAACTVAATHPLGESGSGSAPRALAPPPTTAEQPA